MNKWISVNDRLPDNSNVVLAYNLKNSRGIYIHKIYFAFYYEYRWTQSNDAAWKMDVTHWMPLPNPPEEESEPIGNSEQLPIAWIKKEYSPDCGYFFNIYEHEIDGYMPVYTHPMRKLTDEEIAKELEKFISDGGSVFDIWGWTKFILKKANEK